MTFGEKLQKLRKARAWTQEQLAERLGVSRQSLSKWESDAVLPDTANVIALADLFGVSMDYLLLNKEHAQETVPMGMPEGEEEPATQGVIQVIQLVPPRKQAPPAALILGCILLILGAAVWLYFNIAESLDPCIYWIGNQCYTGIQGYIRTRKVELPYYGSIGVMMTGAVTIIFYLALKWWLHHDQKADHMPSEA